MKTNFEKVVEFMRVMGQEVKVRPANPEQKIRDLRIELIREELEELKLAVSQEDIVGVADALADILYVTYGAAAAYGIDVDACFSEVHRSNMSKVGKDGKVLYREDGKVLKPSTYFAPDLETIILDQCDGLYDGETILSVKKKGKEGTAFIRSADGVVTEHKIKYSEHTKHWELSDE